jgi:3-hydroxyisobutyrate dehydrogenase
VKIGFIGTGLMGTPMAQRLVPSVLPWVESLTVYNRTIEKLAPLQAMGAVPARRGVDVLAQAEVVILMLTDAVAIAELLFPDIEPPNLQGRTIIQMGTISPLESQTLHDRVVQAGGEYLEAPVLGSIPEAKTGNLIIMVGSTPEQFQRWQPVLQQLGPEPTWLGPVGHAATVKLALNQLIGSLTTAFGLSLALIQRAGVEPESFMQIVRQSALYAPTFDKKLDRMLTQNYANPNFPSKHLLKDMNLFAQTAETVGLPTESIQAIARLIEQAIEAGFGEADYAAVFDSIISSKK